jgi:ATP-dependent Clp protease ATP-binding subunit ClpA
MADLTFPLWTLLQVLDNRLVLAEALGFPEFSRLGANPDRLREQLGRNLRKLLETAPLGSLHRRHLGGRPTSMTVELPLEPPRDSVLWRAPLPLKFHVLTWSHAGSMELAFVPALGIVVLASRADELQIQLPREIRAALARGPELTLPRLLALQRTTKLRVENREIHVQLDSPRKRAVAAERERQRQESPSVLGKVATNLTSLLDEPTHGLGPLVAQLAELLTARQPRSVLLVGPAGAGKTALVRELARRRADHNLGATPFYTTSGGRLVAGMSGFGMWQERCQQVVREAARRKAVVHLGSLVELMQVGKSEHNLVGIAAFLRPALARGELLAVAECTPEQLPLIEREDPHLLAAFHQLPVPEPDAELGRAILAHVAKHLPGGTGRALPVDVLDTLDRLHRRYATYSAYPGRPLRFLRNLLQDHPADQPLTPADELAAFTRETGLPRVLLDPDERLDLAATRRWLAERVVGQPEAVELIVDLLATTKAGLTRPRRPIASLLFIGPTGVGKTEMAKALAEFLFGSRQRLTRFDMSEFADPVAVQRLVGGVFGSEGLLTARVREQPFAVLLLDEFEKAHPLFFDLLLQVLGEGRLTDAAGRLADFSNAVVILTSNLGAESFQKGGIGFGSAAGAAAARDHFVREVQAYLRPELFNRIDRLVPFAPLNQETITLIAERHLERLRARDGIRYRGVSLECGAGVAAHLARRGFDARYGARPLLRAVERELLAPLADRMNRYSADLALDVGVTLAGAGLDISARPRTDPAGRPVGSATADLTLVQAVGKCLDLRRQVQALERSACARALHNELFQLERAQERLERAQQRYAERQAELADALEEVRKIKLGDSPRVTPADQQRLATLARLRQVQGRLRDLVTRTCTLEDESLLGLYAGEEQLTLAGLEGEVDRLEQGLDDLLLTFHCRELPSPDLLTLALFSEEPLWLTELAGAYAVLARERGTRVEMVAYRLPGKPSATTAAPTSQPEAGDGEQAPRLFWRGDVLVAAGSGKQPERELLKRQPVADPDAFLAKPPARLLGVGLGLTGPACAPRFTSEGGPHLLRDPRRGQPVECQVVVSEAKLPAYVPPAGIARRGPGGGPHRRRIYDRGREHIEDTLLKARVPWQNVPLQGPLAGLLDRYLGRWLRELLEE